MQDISRKIAKGAAWMMLLRGLDRSFGVLSTMILTRLLVPGDFGLLAMATTVSALFELMGAFSFDVALIRDQKTTREHFDTVWTITIFFGLVTAIGVCALASSASVFYHEPRLARVMYVIGFVPLIGSFANVGVVYFRKDMDFRREFFYMFGRRAVAFLTTVSLAFTVRSYWALVAGTLLGTMVSVALSYGLHPYRPRFSLAKARELLGFSGWIFANNILMFLSQRSTDLIIGRMAGAQALGSYNVGSDIATMPSTELTAPINRAVFPAYSKLSADLRALRTEYLRVFSMIALITIPASVGVAAVAALIVRVLLGPDFRAVEPLIQIMAFNGLAGAMIANNGMIYLALGRPDIPVKLIGLYLAIVIPAVVFAVRAAGPIGAAWTIMIATMCLAPINYFIVSSMLTIRMGEIIRRLWRPILATATMWFVVSRLVNLWGVDARAWLGAGILAAVILVGMVIYVSGVALLWIFSGSSGGAERFILDKIVSTLRRA